MPDGPISVGSVSVSIVPSAEGFKAKADALTDGTTAKVKLDPDAEGFDEKVAAATQTRDARGRFVKVAVDVDTTEAKVELDELDAKIDETNRKARTAGDSAGGAGSGFSLMAAGMAAAVPLLPELAGGLIAVSGAAAVAGAGLLSFGAVALTDITSATTATQELQAAQTAVNNATSNSARADALVKQKALVDSLGPSTIALAGALNTLEGIWKGFAAAFTPAITRDVTQFATLLTDALPKIQPLISAGAGAVSTILSHLDAALGSPDAKAFFTWISGAAAHDILGLTGALGGFAGGILELFKDFAPLETLVVNGLNSMGASFEKWAAGLSATQGFQEFLKYAKENGPLLTKTLADVATALGHILEALTPLLPFLLHITDFAAQVLTSFPPAIILFGSLGTVALIAAGKLDIFASSATAAGDAAGAAAGAGKIGLLSSALVAIPGLAVVAGLAISKLSGGDNFGIGNTDLTGKSPAQVAAFLKSAGLPYVGPSGKGPSAEALDQLNYVAASTGTGPRGSALDRADALGANQAVTYGVTFDPSASPGGAHGGTGNPPAYSLPNTSNPGAAAANAAANNAAGLAALIGLNLMQSLASGITTGINPLTQAFTNINLKLTGPAQTLGTALESVFTSALAFGQAAAKSLAFSVNGANTVGTVTNVHIDPRTGVRTDSVQSQLVGNAFNTLLTDQKFVTDLQKAAAMGLAPSLRAQFINNGPNSLPILDALVNSGSGAVSQLNSENAAITALGNSYGLQVAGDQYGPQEVTILGQIRDLLAVAPAHTGTHTATALNHTANVAKLKANTTPSKGVFARAQ